MIKNKIWTAITPRLLAIVTLLAIYNCNPLKAMYCEYCDHLRENCLTVKASVVADRGAAKGKWADDVTPKRGWTCTGATDLGEGIFKQCEMCETEKPRYIHHMTHGDLMFDVGCVCSAYMDGRADDIDSLETARGIAKERQNDLKNYANRREKFPGLRSWGVSQKGNIYINKDGHNIVIVEGEGQYADKYSAIVDRVKLNVWDDTIDLAKLSAFDHLYPPPHNQQVELIGPQQ